MNQLEQVEVHVAEFLASQQRAFGVSKQIGHGLEQSDRFDGMLVLVRVRAVAGHGDCHLQVLYHSTQHFYDRSLLRSLTQQLWIPLQRDVVVHGEVLGQAEAISVNEVRDVWEVKTQVGLVVNEPGLAAFIWRVVFILEVNSLVDQLVPESFSQTSDVPVA